MGIFGKGKGKERKFDFLVVLHSLSPWPAQYKGVYVAWQRGSSRKGATKAVGPVKEEGSSILATYDFRDEAFHVPCTLYQESSGRGYDKKWLMLAVMDGSAKGAKEPLGRVVINLADFAAEDGRAQQAFIVACSKPIAAAAGEARMVITVGCMAKGRGAHTEHSVTATSRSNSSLNCDDDGESLPADERSEGGARGLRSGRTTPSARPSPPPSPSRFLPAGPPAATPRLPSHARGQPQYDEDGFLVDSAEGSQHQTGEAPDARPAGREPPQQALPADAHSDADSDDGFLARAVAAMDTSEAVPTFNPFLPTPMPEDDAGTGDNPFLARGTPAGSAPNPPPPAKQAAALPDSNPFYSPPPPPAPPPRPSAPDPRTFPPRKREPAANPFLPTPLPAAVNPFLANLAAPSGPAAGGAGMARDGGATEPGPPLGPASISPGKDWGAVARAKKGAAPKLAEADEVDSPGALALGYGLPNRSSVPGKPRELRNGVEPEGSGLWSNPFKVADAARRRSADRDKKPAQEAATAPAANGGDAGAGAEAGARTSEWLEQGAQLGAGAGLLLSSPSDAASGSGSAGKTPPTHVGPTSSSGGGGSANPRRGGAAAETATQVPGRLDLSSLRERFDSAATAPAEPSARPAPGSASRPGSAVTAPRPGTEGAEAHAPPRPRDWLRSLPGKDEPFAARPERPGADSPAMSEASEGPQHGPEVGAADAPDEGLLDTAPRANRLMFPLASPPVSPLRSPGGGDLGLPRVGSAGALSGKGLDAGLAEAMLRELRTVAALEAAVYLVRSGKGASRRARAKSVHAPARRLARTTISLGPEEGIIFGLRAIRAVEAAAEGTTDVVGLAFWWSNCLQLRWMLWAMSHGGAGEGDGPSAGVDEFDWVLQVLVPPLRELEAYVFEALFRHLWRTLLEHVTAEPVGAPSSHTHAHTHVPTPGTPPPRPGHSTSDPPSPAKTRSAAGEDAVQHWLEGLQVVYRALIPVSGAATSGHVVLLKHKALTALLRRLDAVLFDKLLAGDEEDVLYAHRSSFAPSWQGEGRGLGGGGGLGWASEEEPSLEPRLLPFPRGRLSFGVGVSLKMAVSRWTNWAADVGLREDAKTGAEDGYALFPRLRATADLLMMPKEVLTDRAIRAEVVPGLPLRRICALLARFQPDDFAPEPLPPGLLEALNSETPTSAATGSPRGRSDAGYEPPSEAALLADGLIEPVSLEMDGESEDETEALADMYDPDRTSDGTQRFALLRELWASAR